MTKKKMSLLVGAAAGAVGSSTLALAAPITPGNLVVYQIGTGAAALSAASSATFLDEFTIIPSAPAVQQIAMPTADAGSQHALTNSGNATSEGELTISPNGQYLAVAGYDAAPGVASISGTAATATQRVVGIIPVSTGVPDTTTTLGTTAFSGNNPRSAITTNGTNIWAGGAGATEATQGGVYYTTIGSTSSTSIIGGNQRQVEIYNGQLYIGSGSATAPANYGISAFNSPLPTSATADTATGIDGSGSPSPYSYVFESLQLGGNNPDTCYVADSGVGIEKWSLEGTAWTETGSVSLSGVTGLTAVDLAGVVSLYATTPTNLDSLIDATGYEGTLAGTPTVLQTAATNTAFRGVAFVSVPEPTALGLVGFGAVGLIRRRRR